MSFYLPLFKTLNDADVHYVVVGGLATVLHGYARFTADVDLVIDLQKPEAEKAIKAFVGLGLKPRLPIVPLQFADANIRESWRTEKNMEVLSFYDPRNPLLSVDLFIYEPIPYRELASRAANKDIEGITILICSINDLIDLKRQSARPRDIEDIKYLREIQRMQEEGDKDEE